VGIHAPNLSLAMRPPFESGITLGAGAGDVKAAARGDILAAPAAAMQAAGLLGSPLSRR